MELEKIKDSDLEGKGVIGQEDVPGLPKEEMQAKIEEIARFAIEKINEVIEYLEQNGATQDDIKNLVLNAGAVTRVFGRAGEVKAMPGDYTAEMVGAAKEKHAAQHKFGGVDEILPEEIGAAKKEHVHGNLTSDGKIGNTNGKIIMTGLGGIIEAIDRSESGFSLKPERKDASGEITAEDGKLYTGYGISNFIFSCDANKTAICHGFLTIGTPQNIGINKESFDFVEDPDEFTNAKAGSRWEFDLLCGDLIIRERS